MYEKSSQEWNGNSDKLRLWQSFIPTGKDQLSSLLLTFLLLLFLSHFLLSYFSYCSHVVNSSICFLLFQFLPLLEAGVNLDHHLQISSLEIHFFCNAFKWEIMTSCISVTGQNILTIDNFHELSVTVDKKRRINWVLLQQGIIFCWLFNCFICLQEDNNAPINFLC